MEKIRSWAAGLPIMAASLYTVTRAFLFVSAVNAQSAAPPKTIETKQELTDFICGIIVYMFWFVIVVSVIMALWAAFTYVTAGDDTEKTSKARRTLTYAAIGIAVAIMASGFPAIISSIFSQNPDVALGQACTIF